MPALRLGRAFPSARFDYPSVSSLHLVDLRQYRNFYRLSIIYAFRPRLRSRLTPGGRTFPGKPQTLDGEVSRLSLATYAGILSCIKSTTAFAIASALIHCSSTDTIARIPKLRWQVLAPIIFRAPSLDQWAITHSLNAWLLLSQRPGCLCNDTSFTT